MDNIMTGLCYFVDLIFQLYNHYLFQDFLFRDIFDLNNEICIIGQLNPVNDHNIFESQTSMLYNRIQYLSGFKLLFSTYTYAI